MGPCWLRIISGIGLLQRVGLTATDVPCRWKRAGKPKKPLKPCLGNGTSGDSQCHFEQPQLPQTVSALEVEVQNPAAHQDADVYATMLTPDTAPENKQADCVTLPLRSEAEAGIAPEQNPAQAEATVPDLPASQAVCMVTSHPHISLPAPEEAAHAAELPQSAPAAGSGIKAGSREDVPLTLLLFEEVDNLQPEDRGFLAALLDLLSQSKVPPAAPQPHLQLLILVGYSIDRLCSMVGHS